MSLSPVYGEEPAWETGVPACFAPLPGELTPVFQKNVRVTPPRGSTDLFRVKFPALPRAYIAVCGTQALFYVCGNTETTCDVRSAEVRPRFLELFVYTRLGAAGAKRPPGKQVTRWWDTPTRGLAQPLQDAIMGTGCQETVVYMVRLLLARGDAWVAVWRLKGGLYTYDMMQTLHGSGEKAMAALKATLARACPEVWTTGSFVFRGRGPNPEPHFPTAAEAPKAAFHGWPPRVLQSPLTKTPKFVLDSGKACCWPDMQNVPQATFDVHGRATIRIRLPDEISERVGWQFALGASTKQKIAAQPAENEDGTLVCLVRTETWAALAERTANPWLVVFLRGPGVTAAVPVPRFMLYDTISGRGVGADASKALPVCVLLSRAEFLELGKKRASRGVVAVGILDYPDKIDPAPSGLAARVVSTTSQQRREQIREHAAAIEAAPGFAEALRQFSKVPHPTHRHVAAVFKGRRVDPTALSGRHWSLFMASCSRRMPKLGAATVSALLGALPGADPGDNGEMLGLVGALRARGLAAEAGRVEKKHNKGVLRYLVRANAVPEQLFNKCKTAKRCLKQGAVGIWLRLIASEPHGFKEYPNWKTRVPIPMYARATAAAIWAKASSREAQAVDAAIPSLRLRLAADNGVLAYIGDFVERKPNGKFRFAAALCA